MASLQPQQQHPRQQQPPPYSRDSVSLLPHIATRTLDSPPHLSKIPTLEPLPTSVSSPQIPYTYSPADPLIGRTTSNSSGKQWGSNLQAHHLPSVPQGDPSLRASPTDSASAMSLDEGRSASMEDADDRMAAEALCGLGKVGKCCGAPSESSNLADVLPDSTRSIARSTSGYETPLKYYPIEIEHTRSAAANGDAEPLLSLLTSSHPWLGGTINGSLSAYSSTKSHSPRFIQYGADFVERTIGSPVANTVGTVGRKTGVEKGLRKYLGARRPSELDSIDPEILGEETGSKRRRISADLALDGQMGHSPRRTLTGHSSVDTLPVYDENRSPAYEDSDSARMQRTPNLARSWSTQLMISTSGLGAALNDASLRSLKFVLSILRSANSHVTSLMEALKRILHDYEGGGGAIRLEEGQLLSEKTGAMRLEGPSTHQQQNSAVTERIKHLNAEIWNTLKSVVNTVSRYTGGALPENASVIVRWQLMSVPRRWQKAMSSQPPNSSIGTDEKEAVTSAHRMLAFAVEGIDMMEQVGGVVDSTILSAERWLDSMGRRAKPEDKMAEDVSMTDANEAKQHASKPGGADGMLVDASS